MPIGSGSIPWPTAISLMSTVRSLDRAQIQVQVEAPVGCSVVTWARDAVVGEFLKSDFTHLFWVDSDIVWLPKDFIRLLGFGAIYPIIGAAYPLKKDPPTVLINTVGEKGDRAVNGHGNVQVKSLGLGFTCVQREVIAHLASTKLTVRDTLNNTEYPDMFRIGRKPDGGALGEDVAFFEDLDALGYEAWLDPSVKLGHVGPKIYTGDVIAALGLNDYTQEKKE